MTQFCNYLSMDNSNSNFEESIYFLFFIACIAMFHECYEFACILQISTCVTQTPARMEQLVPTSGHHTTVRVLWAMLVITVKVSEISNNMNQCIEVNN